MRRGPAAALVLSLTVVLAGCGATAPAAQDSAPSGDSGAYAAEVLARLDRITTKVRIYETYAEAMPNRSFKHSSGVGRASDAVVRGRIVGVEKGRGFTADDEGENITELAFDDSLAGWKSFHLRVAVDEQLGGETVGTELLTGLTFISYDVDFERLGESFKSLGDVVVPVTRNERVNQTFAYDPAVVAVADGGDLLAKVEPDGELGMPFVDAVIATQFLADTPNLSLLRQELAKPPTVTVRKRSNFG